MLQETGGAYACANYFDFLIFVTSNSHVMFHVFLTFTKMERFYYNKNVDINIAQSRIFSRIH